jgi:hypothetical protein
MKKLFLLSLLVLLSSTYSAHAQEYNFRHTRWGMTQEEVRKAENGEPDPRFSQGNVLIWQAEVAGEKVAVVYTFAFNKLIRAKYMILKYSSAGRNQFKVGPSPVLGEFIVDFRKFELLIEKYGQPNEQRKGAPKEVHEDKRDDPEALDNQTKMIMESILYHKNVWYSKWNLKDTIIMLILAGESGEMKFEIGYSSTKFADLEKKPAL